VFIADLSEPREAFGIDFRKILLQLELNGLHVVITKLANIFFCHALSALYAGL
jgi:hypothetical protein